ncbi:MAG: type II toxin-antitoxin system Phd/YefM family antitoxin [Thermomicrobiales bacterium]
MPIRTVNENVKTTMKMLGVSQARACWSQLLDEVAAGQSVTITKRGVPIARLTPAQPPIPPDIGKKIEEWRDFRRRNNISLGGLSIRELIEEGRM